MWAWLWHMGSLARFIVEMAIYSIYRNMFFSAVDNVLCPDLALYPKLFFVSACRGHALPEHLSVDGDHFGKYITAEQNFFIGYSTTPDHVSWRTEDGAACLTLSCVKRLSWYPNGFAGDRENPREPERRLSQVHPGSHQAPSHQALPGERA